METPDPRTLAHSVTAGTAGTTETPETRNYGTAIKNDGTDETAMAQMTSELQKEKKGELRSSRSAVPLFISAVTRSSVPSLFHLCHHF
jgi:hypothetical protein